MTINEIAQPASVVGPVRYELFVPIPDEWAGPSDDVAFTVNGLTLPRVDDDLTFEGKGVLMVKVKKIDHSFFSDKNRSPRRTITVSTAPFNVSRETLLRLRDTAELEQWIAQFSMLEMFED
ncbi:hypothetical protein [Nocardia sp. XZ_19_369]|uniref:hypothetical protein n=1 Tax=Nocardia sp. XZ_19_369 TaxID=2769487 RepID=UPI0018905F2C|nr:hypothetical protein [Nocardia sp. XZ_19_369]